MVELEENALNDLENILECDEWQDYRRFGGDGRNYNLSNNRTRRILCCKRLRNPSYKHAEKNVLKKYKKKYIYGGSGLLGYQASFLYYFERTPKRRKQISHICGLPIPNGYSVCIEPTHLIDETKILNDKRSICHCFIRHYELRYLRKKNRKQKKLRGPIFVKDIPSAAKKRIAKEVRQINDECKLNGSDGAKYKCPHTNNPCFINYMELDHGEAA